MTVKPPLKELSPIKLSLVGSDTDDVVNVEKVANGRMEVTVMVTRGWLHTVELRIRLPGIDRLNEFQLAPVPTKADVEFMVRRWASINAGDRWIEFPVVKQSRTSGTLKQKTYPLRAIMQLYN